MAENKRIQTPSYIPLPFQHSLGRARPWKQKDWAVPHHDDEQGSEGMGATSLWLNNISLRAMKEKRNKEKGVRGDPPKKSKERGMSHGRQIALTPH